VTPIVLRAVEIVVARIGRTTVDRGRAGAEGEVVVAWVPVIREANESGIRFIVPVGPSGERSPVVARGSVEDGVVGDDGSAIVRHEHAARARRRDREVRFDVENVERAPVLRCTVSPKARAFDRELGRAVEIDGASTTLRKPLQQACKAAGIDRRFTPHGFRRTFNNLLRQVTTTTVQKALTGHATDRMAEHYSHVAAAEKKAAAGAVVSMVRTAGADRGADPSDGSKKAD
jgi:integrase